MIKIFLTGAVTPNEFQINPAISTGDYMSSVEVRNGAVDTLFGGISEFSKINTKPEYCLIAIKNGGKIKTNVVIKAVNAVGAYSELALAVVEPTDDGSGNNVFEHIPDRFSAPYYADFADAAGVTIPSFKKNAVYGVWLKRTVSAAALIPLTTDQLIAAYDAGQSLPSEDDMIVSIDYTEAP